MTKNKTKRDKNLEAEQAHWHPQGRWWLMLSGVGVILVVGFLIFLVSDSAALSATISVIVTALVALLEALEVIHLLRRLSHSIGRSRRSQGAIIGLLVMGAGLWIFPGRWQVVQSNCGDLGCKPATVVHRFAFDHWTGQGSAPAVDANLSIESMRKVIFQKLSCVDGLQGIEPITDNILDELDLLINGALTIQSDIELSAQLIEPKRRNQMQLVTERQSLHEDQTQLELTLLTLQNNVFQKILRAIDIQLQPENAALVNRIPTDDPEALRLNNQAFVLIGRKDEADTAALNLNNQALDLITLGELEQAEALLKSALARDPRYANAYNNLGQIYRRQGDLSRAIEHYELATELLPCVALYHFNLGFAYEEDQQYDQAIVAYKAALARNPLYLKAFNNLGFVYRHTGNLDTAEQYLQQGLTIDPEASYLNKNLGRVYLEQGHTSEAIDALKKAVTSFTDYAEARYYLAEAYRQAGEAQNACDQLAVYAPLAAADALDDPARVQAATVLSATLTCSTRGVIP